MVRKAAEEGNETIGQWFRRRAALNPKYLGEGRGVNSMIYADWAADHPGEELTPRIRAYIANVKSIERGKQRKRKRQLGKTSEGQKAVHNALGTGGSKLERLEEGIDDCLSLAKGLDREGLDEVIKLLRRARNEVVIMMGR